MMERMADYQSQSRLFADYPKQVVDVEGVGEIEMGLLYTALGLAGEAGEYADKVKKILRGDDNRPSTEALMAELGDVYWYLAQSAECLGTTLDEVAAANIRKLEGRRSRGSIKGSGDVR